ncbi:MAG: hypothetical protein L0323_00505 [Planctomycetes bacterium]|nr:hypothetical protein [Planctomycetota bacterium]
MIEREELLRIAAWVQLFLVVVNFGLVRLMGWKSELEKLPLLAREVFHVHLWFVGLTCAIFGGLTWRFAPEMASGTSEPLRWLAGAIGSFWGIRALLQVAYYSPSHWKGRFWKTLVHFTCLAGYGGMGVVYLETALKP